MKILLPTLLLLASAPGLGLALQKDRPAAVACDPFQPGPEHALLQQLTGTFDAVLVCTDPTGAERRTRGTLTTAAHTAFHTVDTFKGELLGMELLGHGMNGYCTARKQYFTFWTDSMTSSPLTLRGDYDGERRELHMSGECFGPSGALEPCRAVTRFLDADHHTWTLYGAGPDGREVQRLRIEYTRKK